MACSKYEYELGYEENRFEIVVSQRFHCPICFLVLKDPVMCKNEHYYCSFCIKKHLQNSSFCPTCLEHLTVATLRPASRIVNDYISELNIHCDFNSRGCPEMVQVGNLKRHVTSCGFSPVQCSNDGCNVLLNARDKLHHEAEVCDFRKLECNECGQLKNEVKEMKDEMLKSQDKVKNEIKDEMKGTKKEIKDEIKNEMKEGMKEVTDKVLVCLDRMQSKIAKEMKEEVKNEMKNAVRDMKDEIKSEMKEGMKVMIDQVLVRQDQTQSKIVNEMKEAKKEMKDEIKNGMKEGMKVMIDQVVVRQDQTQSKIVNEMKEVKNETKIEIKNEMKEGMKVMIDQVVVRQDQTQSKIVNEMKEVRKGMKNEVRDMKDEIKNEMKKGMKVMIDQVLVRQDQTQSKIVNEMKEAKNEMKDEIKNEMKEGMKVMIGQVVVRQDQTKSKIVNEMKEVKNEMKNEMKNEVRNMKDEINNKMKEGMKVMIHHVLVRQDHTQSKTVNEMKEEVKSEMKNEVRDMKDEIKNEMKGMIENEIKGVKNEMKEIVMNAVRDAMAEIKDLEVERENSNQSSQATRSPDARENIFLVGGEHGESGSNVKNKSTECFNWADQTWTLLNSAAFEGRSYSCSFLYRGEMVVAGGRVDGDHIKDTLQRLNVANPAATWKDFAVNLPVKCEGHKVVNDNDLLFMSGGWVQATVWGVATRSDAVYQVQLVPPYSSKMLARFPQPRFYHGMEMFDQKLFILGGHDDKKITASVVQYNLTKKECKEMPSLPYPVYGMATVLWRNNVLVIGGLDGDKARLNRVVMYDVVTGCSQMLPSMKQKRFGCTAVLTGNVVVVMGGRNEKNEYLKSVESFDLERQVWQDLPDMLEPRAFATAVVKPNH